MGNYLMYDHEISTYKWVSWDADTIETKQIEHVFYWFTPFIDLALDLMVCINNTTVLSI